MRPVAIDHAYPIRLLVLAAEAHENETIARYAAAMARGLAREGDEVYLAITPSGWCTPFQPDEPMQFVAWLAPACKETHADSRRGQRARNEAAEATRSLVRAVHPECVLFVAAHAGHGIPLLEGVAATGIPAAVVVLDAHDSRAAASARPIFMRRQACAHQWVATSAQSQKTLARALACPPTALEVCPEGISIHPHLSPPALAGLQRALRDALAIEPDMKIALAAGPLHESSGCLDWARALALMARTTPEAVFIWKGSGPLREPIEHTLEGALPIGRVRILDPEAAPANLEIAADLAIFPNRMPTAGLAIGKAMAAGVPLIATAVDPVPEIVRPMREGLVCPKATPPRLADAIRYALDNPTIMSAMADAAYLRIQDYSDERAVRALRSLLERLSVMRGFVRTPGQTQ